jgi:hypothetical protein
MDIKSATTKAGHKKTKEALDDFLEAYLKPAFGALPKPEVELLVLKLLAGIGAISDRPSVYDLVSNLKVTRSKARKLIYDQELRTRTREELDSDVHDLLRRPILQKKGDAFALEIENPLLSDHIRAKLKALGHVTDGSFSPSLITLSSDAMVALIEDQLSDKDQATARDALIKAGAPDGSFKGVLKGALKKLGEKIAAESGQAVAENISQYVEPILEGSKTAIVSAFKTVFDKDGK